MVPTFLGTAFVTFPLCQFIPGGMIGQIRRQPITGGNLGAATAFSGIRGQLGILGEQPDVLREHFGIDNSENKRWNPDPPADVGCGRATADEMANARICRAPAADRHWRGDPGRQRSRRPERRRERTVWDLQAEARSAGLGRLNTGEQANPGQIDGPPR